MAKHTLSAIITDPIEAAKAAKLHYVSDSEPGITRRKSGTCWKYIDSEGKTIRNKAEYERIEAIKIPPAWTDVWICPSPNGHIQATGRDERRRKQYRYHPRWRQTRSSTKFNRMQLFGNALPKLRETVDKHLRSSGMSREKVLALAVRLLESTLIRVGNPEYARDNNSFGLTTMRDKHVQVTGTKVRFEFKGKSGKRHTIDLQDRRLAKIVKRCRDIPGQDLFQYYDEDDNRHHITSTDVNAYLQEITGDEFTAKDFRTWGGSTRMVVALLNAPIPDSETEGKRSVSQAIKDVAAELGNTTTVCRNYYVCPVVIEAFMDGSLHELYESQQAPKSDYDLQPEEAALMALLDS